MATKTTNGGKRQQSPQRRKSIEQVLSFAWNHRIRVQVLSILNEGTYTPGQIAAIIGEPLSKVSHHIRELAEGGSIELAKVAKARNADQHNYRAVEMPFYSDEEVWAMDDDRHIDSGHVRRQIQPARRTLRRGLTTGEIEAAFAPPRSIAIAGRRMRS